MKIAIIGLWHLGSVMAACLADAGHQVFAYDPDVEITKNISLGKAPIFEAGLDDLLQKTLKNDQLKIINDLSILKQAEIVWVTFDTPVDESDRADIRFIEEQLIKISPFISENSLLLISSQLPAGTTRNLKNKFINLYPEKKLSFIYIPENLRLGNAVKIFNQPDRIIIGLENDNNIDNNKLIIIKLFEKFTKNLIWMSIESAEMTKHAINAFLATSIIFINELANLCEQVGANVADVEVGLKTEERIGNKAYLRAGEAIAGGTLLRDVNFLNDLSIKNNIPTYLLQALLVSNDAHKKWLINKIIKIIPDLKNKTIAILGLTYKPNTNTLRRSIAIEMAKILSEKGVKIVAFDPLVKVLPGDLQNYIELVADEFLLLNKFDALIIGTQCQQFKSEKFIAKLNQFKQKYIFDPNNFLSGVLVDDVLSNYHSVGSII